MNYYMPTKVITGKGCIRDNSQLFRTIGSKAMIVTGRSSARKNGSMDDVIYALEKENIDYVFYDKVMSNPTIACAYEGAQVALESSVDFIIAIGGGSPMDAAKAMALLAKKDMDESELFSGDYGTEALPIVAVPTTAGTGSEVTQYSILTNDQAETKMGLATPLIFPKIAFLDASYMMGLSVNVTINTGIDALSHAVEGILSLRSDLLSETLALKSIQMISETIPTMLKAKEAGMAETFSFEEREQLLIASMLAGIVIVHTGTTAVHAMGYSLTYFRDIDHGRANGLLLGHFMALVNRDAPERISKVIDAMGLESVQGYIELMDKLFGEKEKITLDEIERYSAKAMGTGNIKNCVVRPTQEELVTIYQNAFGL